ncbi:MAG: SprB repeat-containing protein, partial [Cyclobacteriaceae bacterium]
MKHILLAILVISSITFYQKSHGQGWVAEIDLNFNHDFYALERIETVTLTYSGITITDSSSTGQLSLVLRGNGEPAGNINLAIHGVAFEPYNPSDPFSELISATFSGNYNTPCSTGFFEQEGLTPHEQVYIWIKVYPRLVITDLLQECEKLTLTTSTCSPAFLWEAGESISGDYKVISGKSDASITVTTDDLESLGFTSPYGRKYFRVTGLNGTTSLLQAVDIYYPGPSSIAIPKSPACHDGQDGSIQIEITSAYPMVIDDYVVTLFKGIPPAEPFTQDFVNNGSVHTFPDLPAGNYWIRIQNNSHIGTYGSCWTDYTLDPLKNPDAVAITGVELPDFNGYPITCKGGNDGTINAKPAGGTGIYPLYEWTPNVSTTAFAENLIEETYKLRVKDSNNCWSEEYSLTLEAPEKLSAALISTGGKNEFGVSCHDATDGVITPEISGGVPEYSYAWSSGVTTPTLSGVGPGTYKVSVTDANGCKADDELLLVAPAPIDFTITEISGIKCAGDRSGILEVQSPLNTIGTVYYQWSSGESARDIFDKPAGDYSVSVSDDQGCSTSKHHPLIEAKPFTVDILSRSDYNGSPIRCNGEDNGELITIVRDGDNNITSAQNYMWHRNGYELGSGTTLSTLNKLRAGIYKVEIGYRDYCKSEKTFVLTEPDAVTVLISNVSNFNGFPISCHGGTDGSIKASASGGTGDAYTYNWQQSETGAELAGIGAGSYVANARDVNGCEGSATKILKDPDPIKPFISVLSNFNGQPISCFGASDARLKGSAEGGTSVFTFLWNSGQTTRDLIDIPAGNYMLTVMDDNGCAGVTDTTIFDPPKLIARIPDFSNYNGYGVSCNGSMDGYLLAEGLGGAGNYAFSWDGSSYTNALRSDLEAGTYTVMVRDQNGCADATSGIITEPDPVHLEVLGIKNASCNMGSDGEILLFASGGAGNYIYSASRISWQVQAAVKNLKAGTCQLSVLDKNQCLQTITETVGEPPPLYITFENIEPALCGDARGKVSSAVSGGTGEYIYQWSNSQGAIISHEANISGLPSGIFTLKIQDDNLCQAKQSVGITSIDGPKIGISSIIPTSCSYSNDGGALLEISEGQGPFSFLWQDGQDTAEAVDLGKGDHLVEIKDYNSCTVVETVTITGPDSLAVELVEKVEPECHGNCNGKLIVSAKGGDSNYDYDWTSFRGSEINNLCSGIYELKVTDGKGCLSTQSFILNQPEPVSIKSIVAQTPTCEDGCDGRLEITGIGGTGTWQYEWSTGQQTAEIKHLCAGPYSTTVQDANNCSATETFTLENPTKPILDLGGSITLCAGQAHVLDPGSNWKSYSWRSDRGFKSSDQRVIIRDAGIYRLDAVSNNGCIVQDTFILETSNDLLKADFLLASEIVTGDTIVMIDISWPLPEQAIWTLPTEMKHLINLG